MDLKNLKSVFVIAEIGQNHQGDIEVARNVINSEKLSSLPSLINFQVFHYSLSKR
jgi:sialic acid synthase SpsE